LDIQLTDEVLAQLDMEDTLNAEYGSLSLNALAGTEKGEALRLRPLVKNKVMLILVNSGSSHSFVSSSFLAVVGIIPVSAKPKQVRVANGDILISDKIVPQMEWWVQGHSFCTDMRVLELQAYDAILGFDWLITHSPINHHWEHKTIEFVYQGESITLHGIQQNALQLEGVPVERMVKWLVGNDICALAIVDVHLHHTEEQHSHPTVEKLLQEFQDVFAAPSSLPPQ
jgi:hypothetical protein